MAHYQPIVDGEGYILAYDSGAQRRVACAGFDEAAASIKRRLSSTKGREMFKHSESTWLFAVQ